MSARFAITVSLLLAVVLAGSTFAVVHGGQEALLATQGARRDVEVDRLGDTRGWVAAFGCVRHDLAIGVSRRRGAFRLGSQELVRLQAPPAPNAPPPPQTTAPTDDEEPDRVFTPLAAREDCNEEIAPKRIFALVEDDDSLGDTIAHVYRQKVAPPPVPAIVSGVIGYGTGHGRDAARARAFLVAQGGAPAGLADAPLFVKGKRPGAMWLGVVTAAMGLHGLLLVGVAAAWMFRRRRRVRRQQALLGDESSEAEESFFG